MCSMRARKIRGDHVIMNKVNCKRVGVGVRALEKVAVE